MLPSAVLSRGVCLTWRSIIRSSASRSLSVSHRCLNQEENADDSIEQNPFFEKYAEKIKKVQEEEKQFSGPQPRTDSRLRRETEQWKRSIQTVEEKLSAKKKENENRRGSKLPSRLDELIHMDLLDGKTSDEIIHIWSQHFKEKEVVSAVIPTESFVQIMEKSVEYPAFLYPLPKEQGYEFILSQFEGNRCFFTSLINFQVHGENAPWQFCMTFYPELKDKHGIVLMTSELDTSAMNVFEAQCLAQLQKLFYLNSDEKKAELLHVFNKNPDSFKYMKLVKELESSNMVVKASPTT